MNDFVKVNEVYAQYFKEPYPGNNVLLQSHFKTKFLARAAYQVARLPKDGRVEIEAIAHIGPIADK